MRTDNWAFQAGCCWGLACAGVATRFDVGEMPGWVIAALFVAFVSCTFMAARPQGDRDDG